MSTKKLYHVGKKVFERFPIALDKKDWNIHWKDYKPTVVIVDFNSKTWADPDIKTENFNPKFNQIDDKVDRRSHLGIYSIDKDGFPLNPTGRTGVCMRGVLGRWGPNHAADPIVTRWKRDNCTNEIVKNDCSGKPILQFVAIQRKDVLEWAIPGGMVDPGEPIPQTLKREFFEESLNMEQMSKEEYEETNKKLENFFSNGHIVYKGYVDDPRNTDNAWIETVAVNYHDDTGNILQNITLNAGSDARNVKWMDIDSDLHLYSNHLDFIETTVKMKSGHWKKKKEEENCN